MSRRRARGWTAMAALLALAGAELTARRLTAGREAGGPLLHRAAEVVPLAEEPSDLPLPWPAGPALLLIGNSHTYALPGLEVGQPLRPDPGSTLIDELAARLAEDAPDASFYRLAYPNLLAFESLTRVAQLDHEGLRPEVVVVGLTFRNLARGSRMRDRVGQLFRLQEFVDAFRRRLAELDAPERVSESLEDERRRALVELEQERLRSSADRLDERLTAWAGRRLALVGRSAELRAAVYRRLARAIEDWLVREEGTDYSYGVVDSELAANLDHLRTELRWHLDRGARLLVYQAPERDDLPPLVDPARQDRLMAELRAELEPRGVVWVDARRTVPNRFWGWVGNTPDRSHFTEPGHRLLAERLVAEGRRAGLWRALRSDDDGAGASEWQR